MRIPDDLVLKSATLKDQYFDLKGLSAYSALSVSSLRSHIQGDGLPAYRLGGKILIRKSEFDGWIAHFRLNKSKDIDAIVNDVMREIGSASRESRK